MVENVIKSFYIDDYLKSLSSTDEAKLLALHTKEMLSNRGFKLTKWISNSREVIDCIPVEDRAKEIRSLDLDLDNLRIDRALGNFWDAETDTIVIRRKPKPHKMTKRGILSCLSSLYAPTGILAPITLIAKLIFQSECKRKNIGWDEALDKENEKAWTKWINELPMNQEFSLPCGFFPAGWGPLKKVE